MAEQLVENVRAALMLSTGHMDLTHAKVHDALEEAGVHDLLAALEGYLGAKPQCECSDYSGCGMATARVNARAAIAKARGTEGV